jgi:hypothetical protein
MIDSGDAKDVIIKVMDTEPKNRTWVLSLIIILMLAAGNFFFYSRANKAEEKENEEKRELAIQKSLNLSDSKDCLKLIREAERNKDIENKAELNNLRNNYNKELKEKANKLEKELDKIRKKLGQ